MSDTTHPTKDTHSGGPVDRRTFLARAALTGAALAGATAVGWKIRGLRDPVRWDPVAFAPVGPANVAVLHAAYEGGLEDVVLAGLRLIEADARGARVLLKPNFVEYDAGTSVNTDPRLVAAAARAFRRMGAASVVVGEGPGHRRDTQFVIETSGLGAALRDAGTNFVDLNTAAVAPLSLRTSYTSLRELWLPRPVVDADIVVSMPKMKTHHWAGLTLSLKNCFGCVPGRVYGWPKNALHWAGLEDAIVDVASAVRPDLAIIDGIMGMEGNGPINGTPKNVGLLVFGDDPVAADTIGATLMGIDPTKVYHLAQAARFLGQGNRDDIRSVGEDPDRLITPFTPAPGFVDGSVA